MKQEKQKREMFSAAGSVNHRSSRHYQNLSQESAGTPSVSAGRDRTTAAAVSSSSITESPEISVCRNCYSLNSVNERSYVETLSGLNESHRQCDIKERKDVLEALSLVLSVEAHRHIASDSSNVKDVSEISADDLSEKNDRVEGIRAADANNASGTGSLQKKLEGRWNDMLSSMDQLLESIWNKGQNGSCADENTCSGVICVNPEAPGELNQAGPSDILPERPEAFYNETGQTESGSSSDEKACKPNESESDTSSVTSCEALSSKGGKTQGSVSKSMTADNETAGTDAASTAQVGNDAVKADVVKADSSESGTAGADSPDTAAIQSVSKSTAPSSDDKTAQNTHVSSDVQSKNAVSILHASHTESWKRKVPVQCEVLKEEMPAVLLKDTDVDDHDRSGFRNDGDRALNLSAMNAVVNSSRENTAGHRGKESEQLSSETLLEKKVNHNDATCSLQSDGSKVERVQGESIMDDEQAYQSASYSFPDFQSSLQLCLAEMNADIFGRFRPMSDEVSSQAKDDETDKFPLQARGLISGKVGEPVIKGKLIHPIAEGLQIAEGKNHCAALSEFSSQPLTLQDPLKIRSDSSVDNLSNNGINSNDVVKDRETLLTPCIFSNTENQSHIILKEHDVREKTDEITSTGVIEKSDSADTPLSREMHPLPKGLGEGYLLSTKQELNPRSISHEKADGSTQEAVFVGLKVNFKAPANNDKEICPQSEMPSVKPGKPESLLDYVIKPSTELPVLTKEQKASSILPLVNERMTGDQPSREKNVNERVNDLKGLVEKPIAPVKNKDTEPAASVIEAKTVISLFVSSSPLLTAAAETIKPSTSVYERNEAKRTDPAFSVNAVTEPGKEEGCYNDEQRFNKSGGYVQVKKAAASPSVDIRCFSMEVEKAFSPQSHRDSFREVKIQGEKENLIRSAGESTVRVAENKKTVVRQEQASVQNVATSIESVIKKSQGDNWTGNEMAAKLIYLLMKASSTFTFEHSSRVIDLSADLAHEIGVTDEKQLKSIKDGAMFHDLGEVELDLRGASPKEQSRLSNYIDAVDLKNCSFLHDIGKVKIPDSILYKPGRLTDEEFNILKQHPVIGEEILKPIPSMSHVLPVVRHHHEKWDGKGYPDGIAREQIPLEARIVGLTDAYDAMVSDRPYRKGMPVRDAVAELKRCAGTHFDPYLVDAFIRMVDRDTDTDMQQEQASPQQRQSRNESTLS